MLIAADRTFSYRPDWIDALYRGQPLLAGVGILLLLAMIPTGAALGIDGRILNGISVWAKPLKFQASLAVHLITVAWLMRWLPQAQRETTVVRKLAALMAGAALVEIGYISHQASLGQGSHFHVETVYNALMYGLMGIGALVLVGTTGMIGALILRHGERRDPMVLAAGLGLVLGSVLGLLTGASLSINHGHWVGGVASDVGGVPILGWSRTGGDLRVAHFVGLHLMQVLPIAALLARRVVGDAGARQATWAAAGLGTAATIAAYVQAWMGLPLIPV